MADGARIAAIASVLFLFVGSAQARTWTNDKGETIEAELVNVSGNVAQLNKGGEAIRAPIDRLSPADQKYLEAYKELRKFRDWTTADGQSRRARYVAYRDGKVVLKVGGYEEEFDLADFVEADRKAVEELESFAETEAPSRWDRPTASEPAAPEVRTWTNSAGKEIEAEYRRLDGDKVVVWFKEREWKFPLDDLSLTDQQYVASMQVQATASPNPGALAGGRTERSNAPTAGGSNFDGALGDIRGRMNPGYDGSTSGRDFAAEARARHEQISAEHEQRIAEMRERSNSRPAPSAPSRTLGDPIVSAPAPSISEPHFPAPRSSRPDLSQPRPSIPEPTYSPPQPSVPQMTDGWECGTCKGVIRGKSFKAGDKCPHCGVRFDYVTDGNGNVISGSRSGGSTRIPLRPIVWVIVGALSVLGWIGRQMLGS